MKLFSSLVLCCFCLLGKAQTPTILTAPVGIGTSSPEQSLDINGTFQLRRVADATSNADQNSSIINLQCAIWSGSSTNKNWSIINKANGGISRFSLRQNNGVERLAFDEDGAFNLKEHWGGLVMYTNPAQGWLRVNNYLFADGGFSSYSVASQILQGYTWTNTKITLDQSIIYKATYDEVASTAHKFTTMYPFDIPGSNIASFDNGGASVFTIDKDGIVYATKQIAIGTNDLQKIGTNALAVNGTAIFTKAKVSLYSSSSWPDYVFHKEYKLPKLNELEVYINANGHLPEVPTASEVGKNGFDLGDNQALLLKKIEELTLILIDLNKKVDQLSTDNTILQNKLGQK